MSVTDRILELVRPECSLPPFWGLDWEVIEGELGHRLPSDYKRLCEELPPGRFRGVLRVRHPLGSHAGSLLGREAALIEGVRAAAGATAWEWSRDDLDEATVADLLYPCLVTDEGDVGYWIAATADPDEWTVMYGGGREARLRDTGLSLSALLHDFLTEDGAGPAPLFSSDF